MTAKSTAIDAEPAAIARSPQVRLQLQSNALLLAGARELVSAVAKRFGFADEACGQIALAVDEALCNVIRHGYNRAPDRPIWLSIFAEGNGWDHAAPAIPATPVNTSTGCGHAGAAGAGCGSGACQPERHPDALRIIIEDEARQVDPAQIKSRNLDEVRPGGLGVHIIKSVMDEAVYEPRERIGMRLTMLKRRQGGKGGPSASTARASACGAEPEGGTGHG